MSVTSDETSTPIIPKQLRLARKALALSTEEVAAQLSIQADELERWEQGPETPPIEQLWALAELYRRSVDYFLAPTEPLPEQVSFRSTRLKELRGLSLEARASIVRFEELCRAAHDLEQLLGRYRKVMVERLPREVDPEYLAQKERIRLELEEKPIRKFRSVLEERGVLTFELKIPSNEFAGFSYWHSDYGPCVLVNASDPAGRRNFTYAHEYAHLLQEDSASLCDLTDIAEERFANRFATCFLMPASYIEKWFHLQEVPPESLKAKDLGVLAGRYGVSLEALGYRLEELGLSPAGYTKWLMDELEAQPRHYRAPKAPLWRRRLGETYVSLALEAYSRELISIGKLAKYLGLDVRQTLNIVEKHQAKQATDNV